jgi:taurine dioxygenase
LLYSINVPTSGGDTLFQNSYAAYESLPAATRARIENLSGTYQYGGRLARGVEMLEEDDRHRPRAVHRLVRIHPDSGRRTLFFDGGKIMDIVGLPQAESDALIAELAAHVQTDGDYRHKWQPGDLVIWDNRCSLHAATGDYPLDQRRTMWRATIMERDHAPRERAIRASLEQALQTSAAHH